MVRKFDKFLDDIQFVIMSFLTKLGPFAVAAMPGTFSAYSIFHIFEAEAGRPFALFLALLVGFSLEGVGIISTHTALNLYNGKEEGIVKPVKFWLMFALVPVYVLSVAGIVYNSGDAFLPLVKSLGIASPFLTCIVYVAVALERDIKRIEVRAGEREAKEDEAEQDEKTFEREKELLEIRLKHEAKLARIDAKKVSNRAVHERRASVNETVQNGVKYGNIDRFNLSRDEIKRQVMDAMIDIYLDNPEAGVSAVAGRLDVSRQTVYNYQEELEQAGRIKRNGVGIKVL